MASDGFFEVRDPLVEGLTSPSGQGQEDPSREGHRHREETLLAPRAGGCFLLAFHPPDHTQLTALSSLLEHSVAARMTYKNIDDLTDDAPFEFLDPLLSTIMRDPVYLPTSSNIVDRATIAQHLLNDETGDRTRRTLLSSLSSAVRSLQQNAFEGRDAPTAARAQAEDRGVVEGEGRALRLDDWGTGGERRTHRLIN